mgnify:CR=1 FL=1
MTEISTMRTTTRQTGSALVVVLFVVSGLTLIGIAMLGSSMMSLKTAGIRHAPTA